MAQDGCALYYASEELRADREVILTAVAQCGSENPRSDREVVLTAVAQCGEALQSSSTELLGDREVVLTAVVRHGYLLQFASAELRDDLEIVLTAVAQDGCALYHGYLLQFASAESRDDSEVVLMAVAQDSWPLRYANDVGHLWLNHEFVLRMVEMNGCMLQYVMWKLREDREVVRTTVAPNDRAVGYIIDWSLWFDREFVLRMVERNGWMLQYVGGKLRFDREVILRTVMADKLEFLVNCMF